MKRLWFMIDRLHLRIEQKNRVFLLTTIIVSAAIGAVSWLTVGRMFFPGMWSLFCFVGYPGIIIGLFASIMYLFQNEFE